MSKGINKNTNTNNKNAVKECETKFCKSYMPNLMKKIVEKFHKRITKKMSTSEKKDYFEKVLNKNSKKLKKAEIQNFKNCMNTYCNKGCKNTIYEDGKGFSDSLKSHILSNLAKPIKKNKKLMNEIIEFNKKQRIDMFKNKSTVLKDNFYNKLNKKTIKLLKSNGAMSSCGYVDFSKV
jgi:hypothetical protein